jgi:DNA-binding IclR family transcriptional regulator
VYATYAAAPFAWILLHIAREGVVAAPGRVQGVAYFTAAGRASASVMPRRDPFLPSSVDRHKARAEPTIEKCLASLRAAARSILFLSDKILAVDANCAADGTF